MAIEWKILRLIKKTQFYFQNNCLFFNMVSFQLYTFSWALLYLLYIPHIVGLNKKKSLGDKSGECHISYNLVCTTDNTTVVYKYCTMCMSKNSGHFLPVDESIFETIDSVCIHSLDRSSSDMWCDGSSPHQ